MAWRYQYLHVPRADISKLLLEESSSKLEASGTRTQTEFIRELSIAVVEQFFPWLSPSPFLSDLEHCCCLLRLLR